MADVNVHVRAQGTQETVAQLQSVKAAGESASNPAAYRSPRDLGALEKQIRLTSELEMAELRRAGNHAGANRIAEELELMKEQFSIQRTLNNSDEESLAMAEQRLALRRQETEAREAAVVAARAEAAADTEGAAAGGGGGGLNPAALRGGRIGSVGRFLGLAPEVANPIGLAITAALAAAVGTAMVVRGENERREQLEDETWNRGEQFRRQGISTAGSVLGAGAEVQDRAVGEIHAGNEITEQLRALQGQARLAKGDPLPFTDWFTNFGAKLDQFLDPRSGHSTERDQIEKQTAMLQRERLAAAELSNGPLSQKGRNFLQDYNRLTAAGIDPKAAEEAADTASGAGDLRRLGSATRGGARLAIAAGTVRGQAEAQISEMVAAQHRTNQLLQQLQGPHANPNTRPGPTAPPMGFPGNLQHS
jgi:hypothetical protein